MKVTTKINKGFKVKTQVKAGIFLRYGRSLADYTVGIGGVHINHNQTLLRDQANVTDLRGNPE